MPSREITRALGVEALSRNAFCSWSGPTKNGSALSTIRAIASVVAANPLEPAIAPAHSLWVCYCVGKADHRGAWPNFRKAV